MNEKTEARIRQRKFPGIDLIRHETGELEIRQSSSTKTNTILLSGGAKIHEMIFYLRQLLEDSDEY